ARGRCERRHSHRTRRANKKVSSNRRICAIVAPVGPAWDWELLSSTALRASRGVLKSPDDAEDAAQEAMLRAWRAHQRGSQPGHPAAWMAQIARREALRVGARRTAHGAREGCRLEECCAADHAL